MFISFFCCIFVRMKRKLLVSLLLCILFQIMHAQNYRPSGRAFVCVNGEHQLTRTLYGGSTDFRLETSDRPFFAVCKKDQNHQIRLKINGVFLDAVDRCVASYQDGMRSYDLHHAAWGKDAALRIKVVVSQVEERAVWRFRSVGFSGPVRLEVLVSPLGSDYSVKPQILSRTFADEQFVSCTPSNISFLSANQGEGMFEDAEALMKTLGSRIVFQTPDPYINTLGGALGVAANGLWDGHTWLPDGQGTTIRQNVCRAGYLGDVLGWPERSVDYLKSFAALPAAKSSLDSLYWMDALLWHFQYDASPVYLRAMWPVVKKFLAGRPHQQVGIVTRPLAFFYRFNLQAARIAQIMGEDPVPYETEAAAILTLMNGRLWIENKGHWAERQDTTGLQLLHESAAVWSIYAPIDCGACTPEQAYRATKYLEREIPHIPVSYPSCDGLQTISTSNWMPYSQGVNNVIAAEVMHTALAYFQAGRPEAGYQLMKANILDQMYDGQGPANFAQTSQYDKVCGEHGRDDSDCMGISARTLIQGLFGIQPDALNGRCVIRPGFPEIWDSASIHTPYIDFSYRRIGNGHVLEYDITQRFSQPMRIVLRQNMGAGNYNDIEGSAECHQIIRVPAPSRLPEVKFFSGYELPVEASDYGLDEPVFDRKLKTQKLDKLFNGWVTDISSSVVDSVFRQQIIKDEYVMMGIPFRSPQIGDNIILTSLDEKYPDYISIPMSAVAQRAWLLMAGTTNYRLSRFVNGLVIARYKDGTADTLQLVNPDNWCPIEQDYYVDSCSFKTFHPRPYRVSLGTGIVSRDLGTVLGIKGFVNRTIPGGAAQMLCMHLNPFKKLVAIEVRPSAHDVIIGLMALTLQ